MALANGVDHVYRHVVILLESLTLSAISRLDYDDYLQVFVFGSQPATALDGIGGQCKFCVRPEDEPTESARFHASQSSDRARRHSGLRRKSALCRIGSANPPKASFVDSLASLGRHHPWVLTDRVVLLRLRRRRDEDCFSGDVTFTCSEFCQAPVSGYDRAILLVETIRIIVDAGRIQSW
jgi:hypothetical protein